MGKSAANLRKQPSSSKTGKQNTRKKVKRLGKNSIQTYLRPHNLKDENIYNCLNVENPKNIKEKAKQPEKKPSKPQPVIVTDKNCRIDNILSEIGIEKFNCKIMSIGSKVFLDNDNDFIKFSSYLVNKHIEHFTYASKDKKVCKVVLSGLPTLPTEMVAADLALLNIKPDQIIQMTTKVHNPHRALYLIHLNGNETTFQDVQKIKSICHTIVKWSMFKPRFKGPTQCRNCGMYGHGTRNCHRKSACSLCASCEHNQFDCPLKQLPKDASPVFKCSYCTSNKLQPTNHRASDPSCPARNVYIGARNSIASKHGNNRNETTKTASRRHIVVQSVPAPIPPPLKHSFRDVVASSENENKQSTTTENLGTNEDMFSTAELFQIFTSAIEQIRNCRSKLDQIQVISNLLSHVV